MVRHLVIPVYTFDELSDDAKERAREWWRGGGLDYEWWDCTFDDAKTCLAVAGFKVGEIVFSGFSSQGDGACFSGSWDAPSVQLVSSLLSRAPKDKVLRAIAVEANKIKRADRNAYTSITHRGRGNDEHSVVFGSDARTPGLSERIEELARDAMRWIYRQLEREYEWLLSDEHVDESIRCNEYEFTEEGQRC